jgi:hypothetical protein
MSNFFALCLGHLLRIEDGSKIQLSQFDYSRPAIEYMKKFTPDRKQRSWRSTWVDCAQPAGSLPYNLRLNSP